MSDFDDEDFSLGEDSQDEQSGDTEEGKDDFALASDGPDFEELIFKPKKARVAPKKSLESPLPNRKTSSANAPVVKMKSPSCSAKSPIESKALKVEDAEATVLDYMRKTNRPYSVLNVFENMHRAIAKPSLTKLLDNLVFKKELMSKTYGKAKIYYMNQNRLTVPTENERHAVEERIKTITAECATLQQELKNAETTLSTVTSQISDEDLDAALKQLEETAVTLEKKAESLDQPDRVTVSPHMKDTLKRKFVKYHMAWVARKRIAMDGINQIADGMEKKVAVVLDLIGLETDEEVGIKTLPTI